jgi:prepilin-type N-terminal cleavage/methylation domain-containing protein
MIKTKLGFTFVEVIIAMAIFAILVVGIFPAFLIGIKLNTVSQVSVELSSKAQATVEEIYGYSTTKTLAQTVTILTTAYSTPVVSGSTKTFTKTTTDYTYTIAITEDSPLYGMDKVIVNVAKINNPYNVPAAQAETILLFK